jgi:hypothetical protein
MQADFSGRLRILLGQCLQIRIPDAPDIMLKLFRSLSSRAITGRLSDFPKIPEHPPSLLQNFPAVSRRKSKENRICITS